MSNSVNGGVGVAASTSTEPIDGSGPAPVAADIERALALVRHGSLAWAALALAAGVVASVHA